MIMKRTGLFGICIALCSLFLCGKAYAYDYRYRGCYRSECINYQSVDENNEPITLSAMITIPLKTDLETPRRIDFIVLNNPVFVSSNDERPTSDSPMDLGAARRTATEGAMIVEPDGMGYGASYGKTVTMLNFSLAGRQMTDAFFAALEYVREKDLPISDNYYTYNTGYSLGGGYALAVQRYVEQQMTERERETFRLRKTICGGAPAVPRTVYDHYVEAWDELPNGSKRYAPIILDNNLKMYKNGPLHTLQDASLYSTRYLKKKDYGHNISDIFSNEMNDQSSPLFRGMMKTLECNSLTEGWIPEAPILWFHMEDDVLIPYENYLLCLDAWGSDRIEHNNNMMRGLDWNCLALSQFYRLNDAIMEGVGWLNHTAYFIPFMLSIVDGAARDTVVTSTRLANLSLASQLEILADVLAELKIDLNLEISLDDIPGVKGTFVLQQISSRSCNFAIKDGNGTVKATVETQFTDKRNVVRDINVPVDYTITYPDGKVDTGHSANLIAFITWTTARLL